MKNVLYEEGDLWILDHERGFYIMRTGCTHSKRVGIVGKSLGLDYAIKVLKRKLECERNDTK